MKKYFVWPFIIISIHVIFYVLKIIIPCISETEITKCNDANIFFFGYLFNTLILYLILISRHYSLK